MSEFDDDDLNEMVGSEVLDIQNMDELNEVLRHTLAVISKPEDGDEECEVIIPILTAVVGVIPVSLWDEILADESFKVVTLDFPGCERYDFAGKLDNPNLETYEAQVA